jgi:hypothetical protein
MKISTLALTIAVGLSAPAHAFTFSDFTRAAASVFSGHPAPQTSEGVTVTYTGSRLSGIDYIGPRQRQVRVNLTSGQAIAALNYANAWNVRYTRITTIDNWYKKNFLTPTADVSIRYRAGSAFMDGTITHSNDDSYSASSNHRSDSYDDYRPRPN